MKKRLPVFLAVVALWGFVHAGEPPERGGFFSERELSALDDALALTNMTRKDLAFDKMTEPEAYRRFRLSLVDRTLSDPLAAADVAAEWTHPWIRSPGWIIEKAALALDCPLVGQPTPQVGFETRILDKLEQAFSELEPDEIARLGAWASLSLAGGDEQSEEDVEEMLSLAESVNRERIFSAASELFVVIDALANYRPEDEQRPRVGRTGPPGYTDIVKFGTPGDDLHDLRKDPPILVIDPGGNDRYLAPAVATPEHPLTIVIDLGGNDVYGDGSGPSAATASFGVAVLWDRGDGNDLYLGGDRSQGCGVFGVGILMDDGGDDIYDCGDTGQGAGAWGIGLLLDHGEGNDRFHADLFGQGFGYVGGFGLLHNEKGQDVYDAGGVHLHYPLFNDRYQSLSQGFSIGMRPYASGGVGLLVDDAGNDRYACDIYGQGASYWFAYGALVDRDGNDTYTLGQYGQGGGIHLAVGCLLDLAGQDLYYNMHGVGTGGAHDWAVGILVDRAGDDYYAGSGGTLGGALTNSFALLLDGAGNDGYSAVKVRHAEGGGRAARGMGSIGVLLDLAGKDLHGTAHLESAAWIKETYGAGLDFPDPPPPEKAPPRRPSLTPEEVEARIVEKASGDSGDLDFDKLWDLACQWPVGEMADVVPAARAKLVAIGDRTFERTLQRIPTKESLEFLAIQNLVKGFGERCVEPITAMLVSEDHLRGSRAAGLLADLGVKAAAPVIVPLLAHEKTRLGALDALTRLGEKSVWEDVAKLLTDDVERVRVSAVRCLEKLEATDAVPLLVARMREDEIFTVRFAAEDVLVRFGDAAVPSLFSSALGRSDLTQRRHAIRALGRIAPASALPLLVDLSDDADWRIRWDVAGALAAYLAADEALAKVAREVLAARVRVEGEGYVKARLVRLLD